MVFGFLFITWYFETASITSKREREPFCTFSVHVRLMVLELASSENKDERKLRFSIFFQTSFFGFYRAKLKSEDIFVLRRVRAFCRYPFLPLF